MGALTEAQRPPDDIRRAAEALLPQRVADHDGVLVTRTSGARQHAEARDEAEHVEVGRTVGDGLEPRRLSAAAGSDALLQERGDRLDLGGRARGEPLVGDVVGSHLRRAAAVRVVVVDAADPRRIVDVARRTEQQPIEHVGQHHRAADADGQEQQRRQGRGALAPQRPPREPDVLSQRIDARQDARVAEDLTCLREAAEFPPRGEPRLDVREAAPAVFVGQEFEVRLQLLAQLVLAASAGQRGDHTGEQDAQAGHDSGSRRRLTIDTVRAQSCASASSCFRPVAVML